MRKLIIIFIFFTTPLFAAKVERLGFYNIQELLEDDNLTYKIIKSCVSLNSAITEITREDHPKLSKSFFSTANYLYPFGILTLAKIKKVNYQDVEKEYQNDVSSQVSDYMNFMKENGVANQSFIKGTFIGDDLNFCNEIRSAIEITIAETKKLKSKDWERTIQVDVNSHFYFTKKAIPLLKKSKNGSIINISSTAGILGFPLRSPYAASKWAIIGVTKTLAMELGKFNIRVNAVCPGTIKGDRMKRVIRDKAKFTKVSTKVIEKDFVSMSSMKQWILEEDIGKMCSFLISDDSSKVSGQVISVDGHTERND